jgi:hypothetical protein
MPDLSTTSPAPANPTLSNSRRFIAALLNMALPDRLA